MSGIRRTVRVAAWLLLLLVIVGTVAGTHLWRQRNAMLLRAIRAHAGKVAPNAVIQIDSAGFDLAGRVHLSSVSIRPKDSPNQLLVIPNATLVLDREALWRDQRVEVQHVRISGPRLAIRRDEAGRWNWQDALPIKSRGGPLAGFEITDGRLRVEWQTPGDENPRRVHLQSVNIASLPSGKRSMSLEVRAENKTLGQLLADLDWNLNEKSIAGTIDAPDVELDDQLLADIAEIEPRVQQALAKLDASLSTAAGTTASVADPSSALPLVGESALRLRLKRWKAGSTPEWSLAARIRHGKSEHPILPFPLRDIRGLVTFDGKSLALREFSARHGDTELSGHAQLLRQGDQSPASVSLQIEKLPIHSRLWKRLDAGTQRLMNELRPRGLLNASLVWQRTGSGQTTLQGTVLPIGASFKHERFPYPVTDVQGTLRFSADRRLHVKLEAQAGHRPITIRGAARNLGPDAEFVVVVAGENLPIDQTLREACQPAARKTLDALDLHGTADMTFEMRRRRSNPRIEQTLVADLKNSRMRLRSFPLELDSLHGHVEYRDRNWTFTDLKANHGTARLEGNGKFVQTAAQDSQASALDLVIDFEDAEVDQSLRSALPANLQAVWDQFSPSGVLDGTVSLLWTPGQPLILNLPRLRLRDGKVRLAAFPYTWHDVEVKASFADGFVKLEGFSGFHDRTRIGGSGFASVLEDGWRVRLEDFYIDDVPGDPTFRAALPSPIASVFKQLNPRGAWSIGGTVDLSHRGDNPTLAIGWDLRAVLSGVALEAGLPIRDAHGDIRFRGGWDGERLDARGQIELDSLTIWDYQLTNMRGPIRVSDSWITIGSQTARQEGQLLTGEARANSFSAKAIGGTLTVSAAVHLADEPEYQANVTMSQARLEEYARRYIAGRTNLHGVMNGWLQVRGKGSDPDALTGRGQLRLSPAALYELPVVVQILNVLSVAARDRTAFRYAFFDFRIAKQRITFNNIDLIGDSIVLRGQGRARFDGRLRLNFGSRLPHGAIPLAFVGRVLGEVAKDWVGVEVTGTVKKPHASYKPVPKLDDAVKRMLKSFDPTAPPSLRAPAIVPPPWLTQPFRPAAPPPGARRP